MKKFISRLLKSMFESNSVEEYYNPLKKYENASIAQFSCMGTWWFPFLL